jgi:hypothetical protein
LDERQGQEFDGIRTRPDGRRHRQLAPELPDLDRPESGLVKRAVRLERMNLVQRIPDPADGRSYSGSRSATTVSAVPIRAVTGWWGLAIEKPPLAGNLWSKVREVTVRF